MRITTLHIDIPEVILARRQDWPCWYAALKWHAEQLNIWHLIDPDAPNISSTMLRAPTLPPATAELALQLNEQQARYLVWKSERDIFHLAQNQESTIAMSKGSYEAPNREIAKCSDVEEALNIAMASFNTAWEEYSDRKAGLLEINKYIDRTVHADLRLFCQLERMFIDSNTTKAFAQQVVRNLRERLRPTYSIPPTEATQEHGHTNNQARIGGIDLAESSSNTTMLSNVKPTDAAMGMQKEDATTDDTSFHPWSKSTLISSCSAIHLVNSENLLVPGSFRPSTSGQMVHCGSSTLPVLGPRNSGD